jgi:alpha-tubulin suppressor-like RCC1 family protein
MKHILIAITLTILTMAIHVSGAWAACSSPSGNAGKIAYNQTAKTFQYCNGTDWIAMNQPGSGSGGCANPTLDEGYMVYNADHRVMQGCAGNVFQAMGPLDGTGSPEWSMVSSGFQHSCGIKSDGTAWCWGAGSLGQLGNGTTSNFSLSPTPVSGGAVWKSISAGISHSCGIKSDDTAWCWGGGNYLGDGTANQSSVPVQVTGGGTWKKIATGNLHSCGIKSDNTAWCWGFEFYGALGNNATTVTFRLSPVAVVGGHTWKDIAAGDMHSCAIKSDDTAWCWGYQSDGRLGNNVTFGGALATPVAVTGGFTWKSISAKYSTACAIRSNDAAYCWGYGSYGTRGDGSTSQAAGNPVAVLGGHTWKKLESGYLHSCGVKSDDTLWCWGYNGFGQLGNNNTTQQTSPVSLTSGGAWKSVSTGRDYTCALKTSGGALYCWGTNTSGQIAAGPDIGNRDAPDTITGNATWTDITTAFRQSCGIKSDGSAWCWGYDQQEQLGNGAANNNQPSPVAVTGGSVWKKISLGNMHGCGIKSDDTLWCWGENSSGELGIGATGAPQADPVAVSGGGTWKHVTAGVGATCGIKSDDTAWCWGSDTSGKLGNGAAGNANAPALVTGGSTWKAISMGFYNSCGIKSDDTLWCWGNDGSGQLGNGATATDQPDPVAVTGGATWKYISVSYSYACGIKSDDTAWCWGYDGMQQLGNGAPVANQPDPVAVNGGGTWKKISTGFQTTCGIKSDDTAWCWGSDGTLMIGNGAITGLQDSPVQVIGGSLWQTIAASSGNPGEHVCGITTSGVALCWGNNNFGQLGVGTPAYSLAPVNTVCGAPYGKPGAIRYNSTEDRMQYCDSVNWVAFGGFGMGATIPPPDPCAGSPAAGTVCGDGTVYAGLSPDGNVKMFVTRCDAGQSWDGSACTGARTNHFWNDGINNYVATGATSLITGASNTTAITGTDANSVAGGMQQHQAAQYCADLNINGHSDWYLPAQNELAVMYANNATIGNFLTSALGHYWTSTELSANSSTYFDFQMGWDSGSLKQSVNPQRCARK